MANTAEDRGPVDLISRRPRPEVFEDDSEEAFFRLRAELGFDLIFSEEFNILRPYLGRISRLWPVKFQDMIMENAAMADVITARDAVEIDALMKRYARQMLAGRFYEEFHQTTEELAIFFAKRKVSSDWLVSAFMNVFHDAQLEIFFDKEARQGRIVVSALRCLLKIMTLTIQVVNRKTYFYTEKAKLTGRI